MPFVPVPNCVEARLHWNLFGTEEAVNVLHFLKSVSGGDIPAMSHSFAEDLADKITTALTDSTFDEWISQEVTLDHITVKDIDDVDRVQFLVLDHQVTGQGVSSPLPAQVALAVSLYTDNGSRGGRGRCFIGGMTRDALDDASRADPTTRDHLVEWFDALKDFDIENDSVIPDTMHMQLAVASRHAHVGSVATGAPVDPIARPVQNVLCNLRFDTQRRRALSQRF